MIDKICPIVNGKCIGKACEGYYARYTKSCEISETDKDWSKCPANHHEIKIFGKILYSWTGLGYDYYPGCEKGCKGCKHRGKHVYHHCGFSNGNILWDEFVRDVVEE